jgi:curved DNA-binding protein CbpA
MGRDFGQMGSRVARGTQGAASSLNSFAQAAKAARDKLQPLKSEFRALRAESRNIDFGDLTDSAQFQQASRDVEQYINSLKALERQIEGNTFVEREFGASLKQQQRIAQTRVDMAGEQRKAAIASQRLGVSQGLQATGQNILGNLEAPIQSAQQLQQSLGNVKKLADDLSSEGYRDLTNSALNFSAAIGVADTEVTAIFEDLAGAGKGFGKELQDRIGETEGILQVKSALDVSIGAATQLDITLGSIYKHSLNQYAGGVVELNQRTASSINELADNLQNVRISAEDVIPVMKVVMNVAGDAKNFPVSDIAAYGAAISALGTVEPEAAGSFFNRLGTSMAGKFKGAFIENLGYGDEATFGQAVDTDKLGVLLRILEKYKNLEGGELVKGSFLSGIGIKSAQDQKLVQGLANNLDVLIEARKVAAAGFQGEVGKDLSVQAEFNRTMQTGAFQSRRFQAAVTALKDTLGLAIQDALTPFLVDLSDIIAVVLKFTQKYPGLTKAIALGTFGFGALATAIGTAGIVLFGFQQASATAAVAMLSMRSSLLPLTGFFETGLAGMTGGTNALTASLNLLGGVGRIAISPLMALGGVFSFLTSPIMLAIASITSLYVLLESLTPGVNLLGRALSLLAAPVGFIKGLLQGLFAGIAPVIAPLGQQIQRSLVRPLSVVTDALHQAVDTFAVFSSKGQEFGTRLAQGLIDGFNRIGNAWNYTVEWLKSRVTSLLSFFRTIGQMFVSALSENSPGPTFQIRAKWDAAIEYIKEKVASLKNAIASIGQQIADSFSRLVISIQSNFDKFLVYGIRGGIRAAARVLYSEFSIMGGESVSLFGAILKLFQGEFLLFTDGIASFSLSRGFVELLAPLRSEFSLVGAVIGVQVQSILADGKIFQTVLSAMATAVSYVARNLPILASGINYVALAFRALTPLLRRLVPGLGIVLFLVDTVHLLYRALSFLDTKLGWTWLDGLVGGLKTASDGIDLATSKMRGFIVSGINGLISAISTGWTNAFSSITQNWETWTNSVVVRIAVVASAIASIPDTLKTAFTGFLSDSQATLSSFAATLRSWFANLGRNLVQFVPDTIRGVFERLNLANFILLFTSSLPLGLLAGQIKLEFIKAAAMALPGIAAALGMAAFGPLVEAIALALPVISSLLVSSGIADRVTQFFSNVFTQAIDYAVNNLGLQLPDWLKTVGAFTDALDHFFQQLGQLALSLPTPVFFTALSPFILAVISRFNESTKAFELFISKAGGVGRVIGLIGQQLKKLLVPLGYVASMVRDFLTGPPPDLGFIIRPLVAAFNYIKPLLQPIISTVATVLRPLLSSLGIALEPLLSVLSSVASQIYAVLIPAIASIQTNLVGVVTAFLASPAFAALLPFLNLVGGGAIAAGLGVARAASGGAAAVAGGVKSAIDIAAPRLVQAGDLSIRLLGNILKAVLLISRGVTGAAIAPLNILQELLDFSNIEKVTQAAGRVTPIDLLPFFEDVRLGKVQKQTGILVNSLGPLGKTLVQLRFSFVAILEVAGAVGLGLIALEGYLKATGSGFSVFGTAAVFAAQALNVAKIAIYALRLAWVSLRYITLDLSNNLIPPRLAEATPEWVKTTSAVLKVLRDAFLLTGRVVSAALYGIVFALKTVYSAIVILGVVPALEILKYGLILVRTVLEVVTGDFHSLSKGAELVKTAILGITTALYSLRDILIPIALIFGTLLFPRIGLVVTIAVELVRGFKDVRNVFNLTYQTIKFLVGGLYELRGAIGMVGFALFAVFNLSSPWLIALSAGIGWVIEWTRGFRELHQIIDAVNSVIAFLDKSIKGLLDSVFAPISFGPFQGIIDFIKNNWPVILSAFVAFNIFLTRNLFGGFQKSFGIVPRAIGLISTSFQKMLGAFSQIFPFFDRFRREVVVLKKEAVFNQAQMFQGDYIGGRPRPSIGDREMLGRQQEIVKFRSLLEQEALSEARRRHTEKRLQKTYSHRTTEGYQQRLVNPRVGPLDPRRALDSLEARTVQFSTKQIEASRTNVLKDYQRMSAIAQRAGLGGFSLPQLQALSAREGSDYYTQKGILPTLDAKYIEITAGQVVVSANRKQGQRQGIGSIDQEQLGQGAYKQFQEIAKLSKQLSPLSEEDIGIPGVIQTIASNEKLGGKASGISGTGNISQKELNSNDVPGVLGDIYSLRTARGINPLNLQQEKRVSDVLKQLSRQSGSVNLDQLKEVAEHMLIPGARGRMVPPELVEFEKAILEAKIRRQASPSTFNSYAPKGFAEIIRLLQSDRDARQLMEGQGYSEEFINQAITTLTKSRTKSRDPQMRQFNQRKLNELMATLMASEFSLGTVGKGDIGEVFYRSPLADEPRRVGAQGETGVSSDAIFSRFLSKPTYKTTVAQVRAQQESRTRNQSSVRQALNSMYADKFDFGSVVKNTAPNKTAKAAVRNFLVDLSKRTGSPLDESEIDMLKSDLNKANTAQQFQDFIKREIVNKRQGKEFGQFMERYRAAVFMREQGIVPKERMNEQTKKTETISVLETMGEHSKAVTNLQQGNFETLVRKYGFDMGNVGAIANRSGLDVDELYFGEKVPKADKMYARRLRESKMESFAKNAGYSGIDQVLEEMAQDQSGNIDPGRLNAAREKYRKVTEADWGNKKTIEAMQQFSRNMGVDNNEFMNAILSGNLLDEEKNTPKGMGRRISQFFSLRKNKLTAGLVSGIYQDADIRAAQSQINKGLEAAARDRVTGLNAIITQTGGSLPDLLKTLDVNISASDFRKELRLNPSITKLKDLLGGGEVGIKKLKQLSTALGTTTDKLLDTLQEASNLTYIERLQVGFYTALKEFGYKTTAVFSRINKNILSFSFGIQGFLGLDRLDNYYGRLRKVYNRQLEKYNQKNASNLNFMIQEAGFDTAKDFVAYLERSGIDKAAIGNLLKGKTKNIDDRSIKDIARILGLSKRSDSGENIPDTSSLLSSEFTTKAYKPFQSFFSFGLKATLSSKFIRNSLVRSVGAGVQSAISSTGSLLTRVGQVNVRESIEAIASSIERAVARFNMSIATGGGTPATAMERLAKEVRRQIAVNLNKLTLVVTSPLKKLAQAAPNSKISEIVNAAYRSIPDRLLAIALKAREQAAALSSSGAKYQKTIARAEFFEKASRGFENFQNSYPTLRTAISGMFESMGTGFRHLGGEINSKAIGVAKKIGFDELYTKFKQAVKNVPGFSDVDRAARIATIQGFLKQARKGAVAAAQSAEQRRVQFAAPRTLGQAGYNVTDAAGNRATRIQERLNRPDSKFSPTARQYLENKGYKIESLSPEQQDPQVIYGPFVKAFRTIAKAARVSEGLVEKALSNPVVYVLTRWTDLTWFFIKKLPSAIASGFRLASNAVAASTRHMVNLVREAVVQVASRIIQVFPQAAGIIIGSLDLISRASRFVGDEISQFLSNPANYVSNSWARAVNFISSLWNKLTGAASKLGTWLVNKLNHGAADVTAEAWARTQNSTAENMQHMAQNATAAGHQIEGAMVHAAQSTDETLTHATRNPLAAFGKLQHAVMAIGGLGVGLSTIGNSLQESNPALSATLTKMSGIVFAIDAVGGAVYALQQFGGNLFQFFTDESVLNFLGAVKTRILATLPAIRAFGVALKSQFLSGALFTNPIFLAIAGISAAITALYFAFKNNFLGIRDLIASVAPIFQKVAEIITGAVQSISNAISALTSNMGTMIPQILLIGAVTVSSMDSLPIKEILVSKLEATEKAISPIAARISRKIQGDTHYTTLGISPTAKPEDVKAAYRSKAKQFHPDLNQSKAASDEFIKVSEAYRTLADAERRVAYDAVASTKAMGGFTHSLKRLPELLSSGVTGGMGLLKNFIKELPGIVDTAGKRSLELVKLLMGDAVSAVASNFPKLYKVIERIAQAILKKFGQLGTGAKKLFNFFVNPTDVAAFGMHRLGDAISGLSPQVGKALHGLGDLTAWYGDFMGLHSMVYAGLKKFKLTQPLANLAKTIATSHPLLEKFARFSKGMADDGFEFLAKNYGDRFKNQISKLNPVLASLKSKFAEFASSVVSAFSTRWSSFVTVWPGMVDGAAKAIQPKFQGLTNFLTGVGNQMLLTGTSLTQPLLKAGTAAAVQAGILVPSNQAIAASYAGTAVAANSSSLTIVKSSGRSAIAVATEAGEIIPLNLSMAGSFGALAAGVTTATTAVWAFVSPWVIAVSTALAPFLPVILGVIGAVALFGVIWRTNLFGLGSAIKPLLDFSIGLLKIVGAAIYVVSGLFLVITAVKLAGMVLRNVFGLIGSTIHQTQKTVAGSWFGDFLSKLAAPFKFAWNALNTLADGILGIGRGGQIVNEILEDIAKHPVRFLQTSFMAINWLVKSLIKPLLLLTTGAWGLAKAFGGGVVGAISSISGLLGGVINALEALWTSVASFLQSAFQNTLNYFGQIDWVAVSTGATDALTGIGMAILQPFVWVYNQIDAIAKKSTEVFDALGAKLSKIPVVGLAFQKGLTPPPTTEAAQSPLVAEAAIPSLIQQTPTGAAISSPVVDAQSPLAAASGQVQQAWTGFGSWFGSFMQNLPEDAQIAGQGLISALNCWPTVVIPQSWERAAGEIGGSLTGLTQEAVTRGEEIAQGMQQAIEPSLLGVFQKVKLLRQGFDMKGVQMILGEESLGDQLSKLQGATIDFRRSFVNALLHLDFSAAGESLATYGRAWLSTGSGILGTVKSMTSSMIAFGIYSLLGLNPLLLVMGGIALAGLAIAFNFLGIRTILGGLIGVIKGLLGVFVSTIKFAVNLGRAIGTIWQGIQLMDFDMIKVGAVNAFSAITGYVKDLWQSLSQGLGGVLQVLRGLFEGLGQVGGGVLSLFGMKGTWVSDVFGRIFSFVGNLASAFISMVTRPQQAWTRFKELLDSILEKVQQVLGKAKDVATNAMEGVKSSPLGQSVRIVKKVVTGESSSIGDAVDQVRFEERLKGKEPGLNLGEQVTAAKINAKKRFDNAVAFTGGLFRRRSKDEDLVAPVNSSSQNNTPQVPKLGTAGNPIKIDQNFPIIPPVKIDTPDIDPLNDTDIPQKSTSRIQKLSAASDSTSNAVSSLGTVVGAFSPQLAAPLYVATSLLSAVNNLGDVATSSKEALAGFADAFPGLGKSMSEMGQRARDIYSGFTSWVGGASIFEKASGLMAGANQFLSSKFEGVTSSAQKLWRQVVVNYQAFGAYDTASMLMSKTSSFLSSRFEGVTSSAQKLWRQVVVNYQAFGVYDTGSMLMSRANSFLSSSFDSLKAFVAQAWTKVASFYEGTPLAATASKVIGAANEFISTTFSNLKSFASMAWQELVAGYEKSGLAASVSKIIGAANEFIANTFGPVKEFATNAWQAIVKAYQDSGLAAGVSKIIGAANEFISSTFNSVKQFAIKAWQAIVTTYQEGGVAAVGSRVIAAANEFISTSFAKVKEFAVQAWTSIVATYQKGGLAAVWAKLMGGANEFISSSFAKVKAFAVQAWAGVVASYEGSALAAMLSNTISRANEFISTSFAKVKEFALKAWATMVATYQEGGIAAVGSKIIAVANEFISSSFAKVKAFAIQAWASIVATYQQGGFAAIGSKIIAAANTLISTSFAGLKNFASQAWQSIVLGYQQGNIAAIASSAIARANQLLSGSFGSLKDFAGNAWGEIVGGYKQGLIATQAQIAQKAAAAAAAATQAAVEVPANAAIAASEQGVAVAASVAGTAQVQSSVAGSAAATTGAGVVASANTVMSSSFARLGMAASKAWAFIVGPLLPIIVIVGALALVIGSVYFAFKSNFLGFGSLLKTFWKSLQQLGKSLATLFSPLMPLFKLVGGLILLVIVGPIMLVVGALTLAVMAINALVQGVIAIASTAFNFLWGLIPQPLRWLIEQASKGIEFAVNALFGGNKGGDQATEDLPHFATGGPVSAGSPGGSVAAILHDNEFVMNPDATRENYGLLQLLNSGVPAEDAIRMIPTTPPAPVALPMGTGGGGTVSTTQPPNIELSITFSGDIVLGGSSSQESAREFMDMIGPEIEQLVVEAMRQRGEFSR